MSQYLNEPAKLLLTLYEISLENSIGYYTKTGISEENLLELAIAGVTKDPVSETMRALFKQGLVLGTVEMEVKLEQYVRKLESVGLVKVKNMSHESYKCILTKRGIEEAKKLKTFIDGYQQ